MASEKRGLDTSASLKFVFQEIGFNFPFWNNSNGIYPTSWALELKDVFRTIFEQ